MTCIIYDKRGFGKNEVERTGKVVVRQAQFLATGEACKVVFWPTPQNQFGKKEREGQKEKNKGGGGCVVGGHSLFNCANQAVPKCLINFLKNCFNTFLHHMDPRRTVRAEGGLVVTSLTFTLTAEAQGSILLNAVLCPVIRLGRCTECLVACLGWKRSGGHQPDIHPHVLHSVGLEFDPSQHCTLPLDMAGKLDWVPSPLSWVRII